ncbi:hypothetical protein A4X09_0g4189 [Tilletia walkeri]|uniref:Uncharacterized protein n=1 Tax=Tilletia walkeri TaxID=117179 RepID=A0A8X7T4I0_9BASI|nr:hypothetical protein A4X09_0g4189 [Tilletia walkeri]
MAATTSTASGFVPAEQIALRFPSATTYAKSSSSHSAAIDEDTLAQIAATNAAYTQPLSTALTILKTSVVGASDTPHASIPDLAHPDEPWFPLQQAAATTSSLSISQQEPHRIALPSLQNLPATFPLEFKVARNGQNLRDLLRRDYKEVQLHLHLPSGDTLPFGIGFSSIPLGMARLLTKDATPGASAATGLIDPASRSTDRWHPWWYSFNAWMEERKLGMAVVGTSYRSLTDKHKRELIIAYKPNPSLPTSFWSSFSTLMLNDAHVPDHSNPSAASQRLLLETEWKGEPLRPTPPQVTDLKIVKVIHKKERVGGLNAEGRWEGAGVDKEGIYAAVWRQANDKANRKIFLPAITANVEKLASASQASSASSL